MDKTEGLPENTVPLVNAGMEALKQNMHNMQRVLIKFTELNWEV